jgi:hypothetical protein
MARVPCYDRRFLPVFYDELSKRKRPFFPARGWWLALAAADREAPCNGAPPIEKPPLGANRVHEVTPPWRQPRHDSSRRQLVRRSSSARAWTADSP